MNTDEKGLIFNIQKFSVHDGPGIRSIVFFKGCPLRCKWCANPEGIEVYPQIALKINRCIGVSKCGFCLGNCPTKAIIDQYGKPHIDRIKCLNCSVCEEICPAKAIEKFGKLMSVEEIIQKVSEDSAYYSRSGGGITLSGGEPLLQSEFVTKLLIEAKKEGLETAIETCGCVSWEMAEPVFERLDYIQYDLKSMDSSKHLKYTGVKNDLILENFKKLCTSYPEKQILVRTPLIPRFNDKVDDVQAIIDFIGRIAKYNKNVRYELLPYHSFGSVKYEYLGWEYPLTGINNMDKAFVNTIKEKLKTSIEIV